MSGRATNLLVRRDVFAGSDIAVNSGGALSKAQTDVIERAAVFRIEADTLRERARATDEAVIREQYLALADRWAMFAANLESEALHISGMH